MANNEQQQPDKSEPSDKRKEELEVAYKRQKDNGAPYQGVEIRTVGEIDWILVQHHWSGNIFVPTGMDRENLSSAHLDEETLNHAGFSNVNLKGAIISSANLNDVQLNFANLSNAHFFRASLEGSGLVGSNLNHATLVGTNLNHSDLSLTDLSGTNLFGASMIGTNLSRALMSAETVLDGTIFDTTTKVLGLRWNGVPLDRVNWTQVSHLGDEPTTKDLHRKKAEERSKLYRNAVQAYHGLTVALRTQGLAKEASKFRLRELVMERKALRYERNYGGWLLNVLLGVVAGHGEKPGRAFVAYLGIVTTFAVIFWLVTNFLHSGAPPLQWYEAAVLSVSSFHGRGFFTNTIQLGDPLAIVAAFEAVMGLFIELVFIATFSRRFLGD